jgi:hypothetical protein
MLARQVDYDALYNDLLQSGIVPEDAAKEVHETFCEGGYDVSAIYAYDNEKDLQMKTILFEKFKVVSNAAIGKDSFVNANFAFQSLMRILATDNLGPWRAMESSNLFGCLVNLLDISATDDEGDKSDGEDEDDEDDHVQLQVESVLDMALYYVQQGVERKRFRSFDTSFVLTADHWAILLKQMDEQIQEKKLTMAFCQLVAILLQLPENVTLFHESHGDEVLGLAVKAHKKNEDLKQLVARIQAMF